MAVTDPAVAEDRAAGKAGCAMPASRSRRASVRAPIPDGTGVPANQEPTWRAPARVSRSTRTGDPPTSTEPRAVSRVPESGISLTPGGASSRSSAAASRVIMAAPGGQATLPGRGSGDTLPP